MNRTTLAAVIALARAGAVDEALRRFSMAGFRADDPVALTVKGRLLKELAIRASGDERQRFYRESAVAYERSAEVAPATYPLINAATLARLGGDGRHAADVALRVLRSIDEQPDEPETPYYRSATRAEALLLLERSDDARTALADAISLAPRAWEDHASTLRQFRLILAAQGQDANWLDAHRPPTSLHFGGHMSFDPKLVRREHLDRTIASVLEEEKVGFGYGALAAGADIIIAEALIERGAELHVVLPGGAAAFASVSVDPFGEGWRRRFNSVLAQAETIRVVRPIDRPPGHNIIGLGDEIAMGAAAMNARRLESEAIQLLVLDPDCEGVSASATVKARSIWAGSGRRERLVRAPREALDASTTIATGQPNDSHPLAVLAIGFASEDNEGACPLERRLDALRNAIEAMPAPLLTPYWAAGRILLAHERLTEAAAAAVALAREGYRVGAHYLAAAPFHDPFSGTDRLAPAATGAAEAAAASTPQGSACVTEDFAAALAARGFDGFACEYVGELDGPDDAQPLGLYALK